MTPAPNRWLWTHTACCRRLPSPLTVRRRARWTLCRRQGQQRRSLGGGTLFCSFAADCAAGWFFSPAILTHTCLPRLQRGHGPPCGGGAPACYHRQRSVCRGGCWWQQPVPFTVCVPQRRVQQTQAQTLQRCALVPFRNALIVDAVLRVGSPGRTAPTPAAPVTVERPPFRAGGPLTANKSPLARRGGGALVEDPSVQAQAQAPATASPPKPLRRPSTTGHVNPGAAAAKRRQAKAERKKVKEMRKQSVANGGATAVEPPVVVEPMAAKPHIVRLSAKMAPSSTGGGVQLMMRSGAELPPTPPVQEQPTEDDGYWSPGASDGDGDDVSGGLGAAAGAGAGASVARPGRPTPAGAAVTSPPPPPPPTVRRPPPTPPVRRR